jgi:hypothetical protein
LLEKEAMSLIAGAQGSEMHAKVHLSGFPKILHLVDIMVGAPEVELLVKFRVSAKS